MELESTAYADSGVYTCQITNTLVTGLTLKSEAITLHVTTPVGIKELTNHFINIYPNPANNTVTIETGNRTVALHIFGNTGRMILHKKRFTGGDVDISHLVSGVYVVKVEDGNQITTRKLVVE